MTAVRPGPGVAALAAGALASLAACGSSSRTSSPTISNLTVAPSTATHGAKTFSAQGILIHFKYPASFRMLRLAPVRRVSGNTTQATQATIGVGRYDVISVTRFPKRPIPVTTLNIARLRPAFDQPISAVFGRQMTSTVTSVGGLPALSYPPTRVAGLPVGATSRVTLVFVADDEYELNCQYTAKGRAAIVAACIQMLDTLRA
jgi:hypothetical protein